MKVICYQLCSTCLMNSFKMWSKHVPWDPLVEILRGEGTLAPCGSFLRSMVLWSLNWVEHLLMQVYTQYFRLMGQSSVMGFLLLEQDHTPRMGTSHTSQEPGDQNVKAAHQGNSPCSSPCQCLSAEFEEEGTECFREMQGCTSFLCLLWEESSI